MTLSFPIADPRLWRRATLLTPSERPALVVVSAMLAVILLGVYAGWIEYDGYMDNIAIVIVLAWTLSTVLLTLKLSVVSVLIRVICMLLAMTLATPLATAALTKISAPLMDDTLMRLDEAMLGVPAWPNIIRLFKGHGFFLQVLSYAYVSLVWQLIALAILLCVLDREKDAWRFATAWGLGLLVCIAVFPFCPALGAYGYLQIDPSTIPDVLCQSAWHYPVTLQSFKDGTFHVLDENALEGIVSMPSFHACAAVLLAWGFFRVPVVSWIMAALNTLMWISAVPIGGHYVVDVIAGTAVAICAIFLSGIQVSSFEILLAKE